MGKGKWDYLKDVCPNCEIFIKEKQITLEVSQMVKEKQIAWIAKKKEELAQKQKENRQKKGMLELYNMPIGETEITVDISKEPRAAETKFGTRDVITIDVNGEPHDWMMNPNSPLYRELLEKISEGKAHMIIVRSGTGIQTRYSIKEAW
jgi:hypothetical protein